jgi:hypothetical protein
VSSCSYKRTYKDRGQIDTVDPLWKTADAESEKNETVDGKSDTNNTIDQCEMDQITDENGVTLKLQLTDGI